MLLLQAKNIFKTACSVLKDTLANSQNKTHGSFWNWVDLSFDVFKHYQTCSFFVFQSD